MNFAEKLAQLEKLKELRDGQKIKLASFKEAVDGADDEKLKTIIADRDALKKDISDTEKSITDLEREIADDEAELKSIAGKIENNKKKEGQTNMNYLDSKKALEDFANIQIKAGGDKDAFKKLWEENLTTKGITNPEVLLPTPVANKIVDAFQNAGSIFSTFVSTGLISMAVARNTVVDATGRAQGHKRGKDKKEQVITLVKKEIRAQYIYKYITLDKETIRENQSTAAIITYVLSELPQRVVMEIERAAIIGDGRESDSDDKITALEAIVDADANWVFKADRSAGALLEDIVKADAEVNASGARYLVMSRQTLADLKLTKNANGDLLYPLGTDFASVLGVSNIFTPDWMPATPVAGEPVAVEYVGDAYKLVGDSVIDSYDNFILAKNKYEYLAEIYIGGALAELKSGAVITVPAP